MLLKLLLNIKKIVNQLKVLHKKDLRLQRRTKKKDKKNLEVIKVLIRMRENPMPLDQRLQALKEPQKLAQLHLNQFIMSKVMMMINGPR